MKLSGGDVGWLLATLLQAFKPLLKSEAFGFPDDKVGMWWWLNQWPRSEGLAGSGCWMVGGCGFGCVGCVLCVGFV